MEARKVLTKKGTWTINKISGLKRIRKEDNIGLNNHKRQKSGNFLSNILKYSDSDQSSKNSDDSESSSDTSEYDFIKKAKEGKSIISSENLNLKDKELIKIKDEVK